jgi:hypothetical protein
MPSQSKFEGINFSQLPIERLTPELLNLGQGFRCARGEFVTLTSNYYGVYES